MATIQTARPGLLRTGMFIVAAVFFTVALAMMGGAVRMFAGPSATLNGIGEEKGIFGILAELPSMFGDALVGTAIAFVVTIVIPWLGRVILNLFRRT